MLPKEQVIEMFKRIKHGTDGQDFMEYLAELSRQNYEAFKKNDSSMNDIHKGYATAVDSLLETFTKCDQYKEPEGTVDPSDLY